MRLCRIAIWNKTKIISAISMTVLMADVSILGYCKYLLRIMGEYLGYMTIPQV
jgi:hypothetical protein